MKKRQPRKLRLKKTTLQRLNGSDLEAAAGGITWICTISVTRSVIGCPYEFPDTEEVCYA